MTADPKAAEREAAARAFAHEILGRSAACGWDGTGFRWHAPQCDRLVAWAATRERDAAVGALREVHLRAREWARNPTYSDDQKQVLRDFAWCAMGDLGLALERGTPPTCATCKRPMVDPARAHDATDAGAAPLCFAAVGSRGAQEECRRYAPGTPATREETPEPCEKCGRETWLRIDLRLCKGCDDPPSICECEPTTGGTK